MSIVSSHREDFDKVVDHFIDDIATLKTGRANPAVLDAVMVEAYGVMNKINQVASITVSDARSIVVQPWDKSIINNVDKAINEANLGISGVNEGDKIRITVPQMTEESRKEIVKILNKKLEDSRIAIRNVRDEIKEEILAAEKNKNFGEDERYLLIEELDKVTGEYNDKLKEIGVKKEQEIMTV